MAEVPLSETDPRCSVNVFSCGCKSPFKEIGESQWAQLVYPLSKYRVEKKNSSANECSQYIWSLLTSSTMYLQ